MIFNWFSDLGERPKEWGEVLLVSGPGERQSRTIDSIDVLLIFVAPESSNSDGMARCSAECLAPESGNPDGVARCSTECLAPESGNPDGLRRCSVDPLSPEGQS